MTIVAVQCRLGSTRLAEKALLPLDSKPLLAWALNAMKKVTADEYWLVCDHASLETFTPIAQDCGWNCFAGPENDVLERFCRLAEKTGADIIVRATGDNPFLFYEAASASITEFTAQNCDYFTFTGLPHGSGIEVLSSAAILKARTLTTNPYDHEHVGPALYNHSNYFTAVFLPAHPEWTDNTLSATADYRTTVDTPADYRKACRIVRYLNSQSKTAPYSSTDILKALSTPQVTSPVLLVPAVGEGKGTGHIRRCLSLAEYFSTKKKLALTADILIQSNASDEATQLIQKSQNTIKKNQLQKNQFLTDIPQKDEYAFIIADAFRMDKTLAQKLSNLAPLIAIDEGSTHTKYFDYLLNILPPANKGRNVNLFAPNLIPLPKNHRDTVHTIQKILISVGGEDPAGFTPIIFDALKKTFPDDSVQIDAPVSGSIPNLKEKLHEYDLVITHYGFTAFEATAAGCALILLATSPIHKTLAKMYGCVCLDIPQCTPERLKTLCNTPENLMPHTLQTVLQLQNADNKATSEYFCRGKPSPRSHTVARYPFLAVFLEFFSKSKVTIDTYKKNWQLRSPYTSATPPDADKLVNTSLLRTANSKISRNAIDTFSASIPDVKKLASTCLPKASNNTNLQSFITDITHSKRYTCPLCGESVQVKKALIYALSTNQCYLLKMLFHSKKSIMQGITRNSEETLIQSSRFNQRSQNTVIARDPVKTIRRCKKCKMLYISFCRANDKQYLKSYFFKEYKKQYGKTYLEDFDSIKAQGHRRMKHITDILCAKKNPPAADKNTVLDIGCAFGPFLSAAKEYDWTPYGTDIAQDAISYVRDVLGFCVSAAPFPDFSPACAFDKNCPPDGTFDAVTMWYVIEHFQNLDAVLKAAAALVKTGGIFAFSTPNAKGVSGRFNASHFFSQSPDDHFTLWEPSHTKRILSNYGFKVKKIVSTGHHSERFPPLLRRLPPPVISTLSRLFCLGDTFEVYCIKKEK